MTYKTMINFLIAVQFLTIIPIKIRCIKESNISKAIFYFPLVGLLLGLILTGADNLFRFLQFRELTIDIFLVLLLAVITGGLHLDGLSDTLDAFLSRKDKEAMLDIMRDSRTGVMGVIGIIAVILLKVGLLWSISMESKAQALILMCILSRWSMVFSMFLFPYARTDGKAGSFIKGTDLKVFIFSAIFMLVLVSLLFGLKGLFIVPVVSFFTYVLAKAIKSKIGGITGDTLGATNELVEILVLFSICIIKESYLWII